MDRLGRGQSAHSNVWSLAIVPTTVVLLSPHFLIYPYSREFYNLR